MARKLRQVGGLRGVLYFAFALSALAQVSVAQEPTIVNLSGTWEMVRRENHSDRVASYVRAGLTAAEQILKITHTGSELNLEWREASERMELYGWTATYFTDGRGEKHTILKSDLKTKTKLKDGKIVIEGSGTAPNGYNERFRDELEISSDGSTLTIKTFRSGDVYRHGKQVMIGPTELRLVRTFQLKR